MFSFIFNWLFISPVCYTHSSTYLSGQGHTPRSKKIRTLRQFGRQHSIFDLRGELHQVFDFLLERNVLEVMGLVRVDSLVSGTGAD